MQVTLTENELQALADKYRNSQTGRVMYSAFCDSVDMAFTTKGLERMPMATVQQTELSAFSEPRQLSDSDEMEVSRVRHASEQAGQPQASTP